MSEPVLRSRPRTWGFRPLVSGILKALRPDLAREEIRISVLCLFGMLNWTYRWFHTLPVKTDVEKVADRMLEIFLNGFVAAE